MINAIGVFFWLITFAAVLRLLRIGNCSLRSRFIELLVLLFIAGLLFFRPHEDIFGGEDPGSYINSGITYNRQQQLFYIDDLLAKVPPEARPSFYYGHSGYGPTKDACLWVRNADLAMVGAHFQPAYPLMIASAIRLGPNSLALFVVPFFAFLVALALRALAFQVIPHRWSGLIAFLIYVSIPLTVWHGRCARPEIIASFMFFAGCALTLQAWQDRQWRNMVDLVIGALCIGFAPFFHITAWLLVIPAAIAVVFFLVIKGRMDFLPFPLIICLTTFGFYAQTIHVTDYYTVRRFLDPVFTRPALIAGGLILLAVITFLAKRHRNKHPAPELKPQSPLFLITSIILTVVLVSFLMTLVFFRNIYGDLPVLGRPVTHYLYLTDFKVITNMLSIPMMVLILAGMCIWLTGRTEKRNYRIILAAVSFPAIMLTGNISDFMMTRYLMVAFVPLSALFLAALLVFILPKETGLWKPLILCAIVCLVAVNRRSHLVTTTEHAGFSRFLRPFAEAIKANKGILLCEYSRIAAPLEHFFGVPALGLDNERKTDYEPMERAWAAIMHSSTNQRAFFITPFHEPVSKYFDFETIYTDSFQDCRIKQARKGLPTEVGKSKLTLRLYRMKLKQPTQTLRGTNCTPAVLKLDQGNMGLRNFANMRDEPFPGQNDDIESVFSNISPLSEKTRQSVMPLLLIPRQERIQARWARGHAEVLLPAALVRPSLLMIYLKAPDPDGSGYVTMQMKWCKVMLGEPRKIKSGNWQWQIWQLPPMPAGSGSDAEWLTIDTEPAWNPGLPNFPNDLGILINQIICLPMQ
jgi:hypothetical protein